MTEPQWKKSSVIESGNYPKTNFVGVLRSIGIVHSEGLDAKVLQLEFEDDKIYSMPLNAKDYGLHEDGSVDGFLAIGKFIHSLEKIDIATGEPNMNNNNPTIKRVETFWAWDEGEPLGFKTEPDITGCTLHNIATPKEIGDTEQTAKAAKWPEWTIKKIEGLQNKTSASTPKTPAKPAGKTQAPQGAPQQPVDSTLGDLIIETLTKPMGLGELRIAMGSIHKIGDIRKAIEANDTIIPLEGGKYRQKTKEELQE